MKALTLHQPWASLIADGRKTIEIQIVGAAAQSYRRSHRHSRWQEG